MKKYSLLFLFLFSAAFAFAAPEPYDHVISFADNNRIFFRHLVNNQRVYYSVCAGDDIEDKERAVQHIEDVFSYALNYWFDEVERYIAARSNGRNDFKDVLDVIANRRMIHKVSCPTDKNTVMPKTV